MAALISALAHSAAEAQAEAYRTASPLKRRRLVLLAETLTAQANSLRAEVA